MEGLGFLRSEPAWTGRPGHDPRALLKLYLYGYMNGVRSSRKLMRECVRNLEAMWLMNNLTPDFQTISDFRTDNKTANKQAFRTFVSILREAKMLNTRGRQTVTRGVFLRTMEHAFILKGF